MLKGHGIGIHAHFLFKRIPAEEERKAWKVFFLLSYFEYFVVLVVNLNLAKNKPEWPLIFVDVVPLSFAGFQLLEIAFVLA